MLCDAHGNGVHLGTRDCSVQRRHQKLVEEGPAPALPTGTLEAIADAALRGALAVGYSAAGTFEFLVDEAERFHFMEINCRIQVEHPVTEMITGIDLVHEQLHIAAGVPLRVRQEDVRLHGVGDRVPGQRRGSGPRLPAAPRAGWTGSSRPAGPFTRVDTHGYPGYLVGPHYDSLLAKVVVWAPDRDLALDRMERALGEFDVAGPGVHTTIPFAPAGPRRCRLPQGPLLDRPGRPLDGSARPPDGPARQRAATSPTTCTDQPERTGVPGPAGDIPRPRRNR